MSRQNERDGLNGRPGQLGTLDQAGPAGSQELPQADQTGPRDVPQADQADPAGSQELPQAGKASEASPSGRDYDKILQGILDVGEEMICCGAEVSRVEESIYRMCESYGADPTRINVFIITSNMQVTMQAPDGRILTHIRRVQRYDANFDRLDYLNDLCREICREQPDAPVIGTRLAEVLARPQQSIWIRFVGGMLGAACFAVFFGGTWPDALATCVLAFFIVLAERFVAPKENNKIVYHFCLSLATGVGALLLARIGLGEHADKIMMGGIMLLIPGIALINTVRDMLTGHIASGLLRLCDTLLVAAAVACGFSGAILLLGGVL